MYLCIYICIYLFFISFIFFEWMNKPRDVGGGSWWSRDMVWIYLLIPSASGFLPAHPPADGS